MGRAEVVTLITRLPAAASAAIERRRDLLVRPQIISGVNSVYIDCIGCRICGRPGHLRAHCAGAAVCAASDRSCANGKHKPEAGAAFSIVNGFSKSELISA